MGEWIQTASGGAFDLEEPTKSAVKIEDVVHALPNLCRFTGHTTRFYSVAEHSVRVSARCLALAYGQDMPEAEARRVALYGLIHDAAEAYTGDLSYPLKRALGSVVRDLFTKIEDHVERSLAGTYASEEVERMVKKADLQLLAWESDRLLRGGRKDEWPILAGIEQLDLSDEISAPALDTDWGRLFERSYKALKSGEPLPFCFAPQYMKRILRAVFADDTVTRWFEPTSAGLNYLADSSGEVINMTKPIKRVEFQ